jgi:putative transposase
MILDSDRLHAVELITEAVLAGAAKFKACAELEMSVRTYQR